MADDRPGTPAKGSHAQLAPEAGVATRAVRGPCVVVDGDRAECSRASRILGDAGYEVISAIDGRAALRQVFGSNEQPCLLVCVIELPGMSGIELAARMSAARPGIQVLLTSSDPAAVERARRHTPLVRGVLLKPYTTDELRAAASAALAPDPGP